MEYKDYVKYLKDYYKQEYASKIKEEELRNYFTIQELESNGILLRNIKLLNQTSGILKFGFKENLTKFRKGTNLILGSEDSNDIFYKTIVRQISGTQIEIEQGYKESIPKLSKDNKWFLCEEVFKIPLEIIQAVWKFDKEDYSRRFIDIFFRGKRPNNNNNNNNNNFLESELQNYYSSINFNPNPSQHNVIKESLKEPELLSVQGPPGTGKTKVLAVIANYYAISDKKVLIISHNHVAVNNALNEIYEINSNINICKVGNKFKSEGLKQGIKVRESKDYEFIYSDSCIAGMSIFSAILKYQYSTKSLCPDIIIVDEASQIPMHLGILIGTINVKTKILFGDEKQMPPIFCNTLEKHNLSISLLKAYNKLFPDLQISLEETYRLNDELTQVVAKSMYEKGNKAFLKSNESSKNRVFKISKNIKDNNLYEILSSEHSFVWVETPCNNSKQINDFEAVLTAKLVIETLKYGYKAKDIAVVTPFRRQINAVKKHISSFSNNIDDFPLIDTVERIQGQSVEIVIISYVASDPDYLTGLSNFIFSRNRLNVAISRAKTKVIFLCSNTIFDIFPLNYTAIKDQAFLLAKKKSASKIIDLKREK